MADESDGTARSVLFAASALAVTAVVVILGVAVAHRPDRQPDRDALTLAAVPAPDAESPQCTRLLAAVPPALGGYARVPIADPAPPGAAAWERESDEAVVLRCGLRRPAEFTVGAPLQIVDGVSWFRVGEQGRSTWYAVDRPVCVALTLPASSGPAPIQEVSELLAAQFPRVQPTPAPPA